MSRIRLLVAPWWALAFVVVAARAQDPVDVAGDWRGVIQTPGSGLAVTVRFRRADAGYSGEIDIPAQNAAGLALADVAVDGDEVRFKIADVPGDPSFSGRWEADGGAIAGMFRQNRMSFALKLTRADAPASRRGRFDPEAFAAWCEAARVAWGVPGLAVAVVETGRPAFVRGFGLRDTAAGAPVGPDTLFPIGSSTKAFTGFLLASLAAEGKLSLDAPLVAAAPRFRASTPELTRQVTPRDFLAHRSGLPRHDLAWYGDVARTRDDFFAAIEHLEATAGLRERWQYNNFGYVAAGAVAEAVAGRSWEELVRERLFAPLGMTRANVSLADLVADADAAKGYGTVDGRPAPRAYRDLKGVAPAGAINASAEAMSRWVRLQLGGGAFEGRRLLPAAAAADLLRPAAFLPADAEEPDGTALGYACGWFVRLHRGKRFLEHGGNIDGFTAAVGFFPDDGFGVVALANLDGAALPGLVLKEAADLLLDAPRSDRSAEALAARSAVEKELARAKSAAASRPSSNPAGARALAEYAGVYRHPAYGRLEVRATDVGLRFDLHGLGADFRRVRHDVFAGTPGGEELLAAARAVFDADFDGDVASVRVPLEPTAAPIVFRREADPALAAAAVLDRYVGRYRGGLQTAQVVREGETLFVKLPGQPRYELVPRRAGRFALKTLAGYALRFEGPDEGPAERAVFEQPNGEFPFARVAARAASRAATRPAVDDGGR